MERSQPDLKSLESKLLYLTSEGDLKDDSELSFLANQEGDTRHEKILLTSYPRSGNTLIRSYMEKISKVYTGSDCDTKRKLNKELLDLGMVGEGKIGDSVWVVKSHFPERIGHSEFSVNKCIVIVRSPIDCFASLFNMIATSSHNKSIKEEDYDKVKDLWNQFIEQEIPAWTNFHEYWSQSPQQVPTYFIRYEDLLLEPKNSLKELFCFLLNKESIQGLVVEKVIEQVLEENKSVGVYKPRSGKINGSQHLYSKEQIRQLKSIAGKQLNRFGYLKSKLIENPTGFISEDEEDIEERKQEQEEEVKEQSESKFPKWMNDFNKKMMKVNMQVNKKQEPKDKCVKVINKPSDIIRKKSSKDPTARGARPIQSMLRKILFGTDKL